MKVLPAAVKLVDGRQLAREQCRGGEARPLRDHDVEPIGHTQDVLADLKPIRRGGVKGQQRTIEAGDFMGFRHRLDIAAIEHGAGPHNGLGRIVVGDVSDEFH